MIAQNNECKDAQRSIDVGKLVNEVITSDVQALVVESDQEAKFDQEASIDDMKNTLTDCAALDGRVTIGGCKC